MRQLHLDRIDHLEAMTLPRSDAQIEAITALFCAARDLLTTITGIGPLPAAAGISEIGTDARGRSRKSDSHGPVEAAVVP